MNNRVSVGLAAVLAATSGLFAGLDTASVAISKASAAPNGQIGSFTYDPVADVAYTQNFTGGGPNILTRVDNAVNGTEVATPLVSEGDLQLYYRHGDLNVSATTTTLISTLLNPKPVVIDVAGGGTTTLAANSFAIIIDGEATRVSTSTSAIDPTESKRVYRWNLQSPPAAGSPPPPYHDARDVMTTLATLAKFQGVVAGTASAGTTSFTINRQCAFSADGQSIYMNASNSGVGGLYKLTLKDNSLSRVYTANTSTTTFNTEPAVRDLGNGSDRVYFQSNSGIVGGDGGLVSIDVTGTTATSPVGVIAPAALADFSNGTAGNIFSVAVDPAGNIYCSNQATQTIFRYDTRGRLAKVLSRAERDILRNSQGLTTSPGAGTLKLKYIDNVSVNKQTGTGTLSVARLMYAETGLDYVTQVFVYEPGDFNRDGLVDSTDADLFKPTLTVRNAQKPKNSDDYKFDLNGVTANAAASGTSDYRSVVDYKDVKVFQQFFPFRDGDSDMNQSVDTVDFAALVGGFGVSGRVWTQGDFTGDDKVDSADFNILVTNYGLDAPALPPLLPGSLPSFGVALVPEPATALLSVSAASFMLGRRKR